MFKQYTREIADKVAKAAAEAQVPDTGGTFEVIASTEDVDRHGEIIRQNGWQLERYLKNPVVLVDHCYEVDCIAGKATDVRIEDGKLIVRGVFAPNEAGQEAQLLYEAGFLKTVSVGFIPLSWDQTNRDVITGAELLELSFVPVPANPEALDNLKKRGIKSSKLLASEEPTMKEVLEAVTGLRSELSEVKKLLVDGKTYSDAEKEQKENLQIAVRAINEALRVSKKNR
ncbi:MAG: HK97 family phage prohead protease [Patescibacteria group bacterium]